MNTDVIEKTKVMCRDWSDVALERIVVNEGERVFYVAFPESDARFSTELWPIGFPKEDVFVWKRGVDGQKMSETEWSTLERYEGR